MTKGSETGGNHVGVDGPGERVGAMAAEVELACVQTGGGGIALAHYWSWLGLIGGVIVEN